MQPKPKRGLYFSEDHIRHARRNMELFPWAAKTYEAWKSECERFMELGELQVYDCVLGMRDEAFAYGISGCPSCGSAFPMNPWEQRDMFSAIGELPAKRVTCPSCRAVMPDASFPDSGQGLEIGPKAYYLIGMWNFYYSGELLGGVRNHEGLVTKLTYLYMLTGDVHYAERAVAILDAYSAIAAGTIGPRDFTAFGGGFEIGRLHMLTSIVHRIKVFLAQDYDWLYGLDGLLDVPSPALERLGLSGTIRENIEAMLNDYMLTEPGGPYYDLKDGNLTNLQNHESDGVRAMLAVGLALDNEDYCRWGRDAVEAYFYNAIGRDGMYYEGSYGYSLFTGTVFLDVALLALRASSEERLAAFHPFGCGRFFRFAVENPLDMMCQGHLPSYGDWGRDSRVGSSADSGLLAEAYRAALYFYQFAPAEELRGKARDTLLELYPAVKESLGGRGVDLFFRHPAEAAALPEGNYRLPTRNTAMGQAGIGIIRGAGDAAVLMRVGPNLTHAHDDALAYQFYDCGMEISADIGYGIYGTNAHFGWGSKAIAHNTVVVNGDSAVKAGQLYKPFAGGEFTFVMQEERITAFEGSAPQLYGIDDYRRLLAVVSYGEGRSYTADFFRVAGAETMDYAFRAFHEASELQLAGVAAKGAEHGTAAEAAAEDTGYCVPEGASASHAGGRGTLSEAAAEDAEDRVPGAPAINAGPWTLAGVDAESKPYFDEPGRSFGERLTTGETFSELLPGEEPRLWTPEPNNGYGYIYGVKEFAPRERFAEARWTAASGTEFRWIGLAGKEDRFFTGLCPSLDGAVKHPIMVQRSRQGQRTFAAVSYAAEAGAPEAVKNGFRISEVEAEGHEATALAVETPDGYTDYWAYSPVAQVITVYVRGQEWEIQGRCAWMRLDAAGRIADSACLCAEFMRYGDAEKPGGRERWMKVIRVDESEGTVWIRKDGALIDAVDEEPRFDESEETVRKQYEKGTKGAVDTGNGQRQYARVRSAGGGRSSLYPVREVKRNGDLVKIRLKDSIVLSKGVVCGLTGDMIDTVYPLPLGVQEAEGAQSPFCGKRIKGRQGGLAEIVAIPELKRIRVRTAAPFEIGEAFDILDIQPGCELMFV